MTPGFYQTQQFLRGLIEIEVLFIVLLLPQSHIQAETVSCL